MIRNKRYDALIEKIVWLAIPILISFFSWLVFMTFQTQTMIKVLEGDGHTRSAMQDRMWNKLEENNKLLLTKAGEKENTDQHKEMLNQIEGIKKQIEKGFRESDFSNNGGIHTSKCKIGDSIQFVSANHKIDNKWNSR